jgi:hypothetical protein
MLHDSPDGEQTELALVPSAVVGGPMAVMQMSAGFLVLVTVRLLGDAL